LYRSLSPNSNGISRLYQEVDNVTIQDSSNKDKEEEEKEKEEEDV